MTHIQHFLDHPTPDVDLLDRDYMHVEVKATTPGKAKTLALSEVSGTVVKVLAVPSDADRYLVVIDPMGGPLV